MSVNENKTKTNAKPAFSREKNNSNAVSAAASPRKRSGSETFSVQAKAKRKRSAAGVPNVNAEAEAEAAKPLPLGNTLIAFPVSHSRRSERWALRDDLREITKLKRVKKCGKVPIAPLISLRANSDGARAGFAGLAVCGSVWVCPVCSAKIASRRKSELEQTLQKAAKDGYRVSMLTLTQRHHNGQKLSQLWKSLSYAWNKVTSGRRWVEFKNQLDLLGYVRATEVTHGKNGWHVHTHVLIISKNDPQNTLLHFQKKQGRRKNPYPAEFIMPSDFVADRWQSGLKKHGIEFIKDRGGLDWEVAKSVSALGKYVAKMQTGGKEIPKSTTDKISSEVTLGGFKKARGENRTPFQILSDIFEYGEAKDLELWREYEKVSYGKRALTWSKGLREWANLQDLTDEEIAEEEVGDEVIASFDHDNWRKLQSAGAAQLLDVTESKGIAAAFRWLEVHEIDYFLPQKE